MRPKGHTVVACKVIEGLITNADKNELPENFALESRGFRIGRERMLTERDYGTILRHAAYPQCSPSLDILSISATTPIVVETTTAHGLNTSDRVIVSGASEASGANGIWTVVYDTATTVALVGSTAGAGGGAVGAIRGYTEIRSAYPLYVPSTATEHEILAVVDLKGNLHIFIEISGAFVEYTGYYISAVATVSFGAEDMTTSFDPVVDVNSVAKTFAVNELAGWICYNASRGTASLITSNTASAVTVQQIIGTDGLNWAENDVLWFFQCSGIFDGYVFQQGLTPHLRWQPNEPQNKVTLIYGSSAAVPVMQVPVKIKYGARSSFGAVAQPTDHEIIYYPWIAGPNLIHFVRAPGDEVYRMWYAAGDVGDLMVVVLGYEPESQLITASDVWHIDKAQTNPNTTTIGSVGSPLVVGNTPSGFTPPSNFKIAPNRLLSNNNAICDLGDGIALVMFAQPEPNDKDYYGRIAITVLYRGTVSAAHYQESDPIFYAHLKTSTGDGFTGAYLWLCLDPAKMNKDIAGFRIYMDAVKQEDVDSYSAWLDSPDEYVQMDEVLLDSVPWWFEANSTYPARTQRYVGKRLYDDALAGIQPSLQSNLGHNPDRNRSYLKHRFSTFAPRSQDNVVVVDDGEKFLRISAISGEGAPMDDVLPDVTVDINRQTLLQPLTKKGAIVGLATVGGVVAVFRTGSVELVDLQSGVIRAVDVDCQAPLSITETPFGVCWVGANGVYILPVGSMRPVSLTETTLKNLIDGTLMVTGTTPYLSDSARQAIVGGFDTANGDLWLQMQLNTADGDTENVCLRYNVARKRFYMRKLLIGTTGNDAVNWFSRKADGSFSIGYARGILKYPQLSGAYRYSDGIPYGAASAGTGLPAKVKINFGSVYANLVNAKLLDFLLNFDGSSVDGMGYFTVRFYANHLTEPFDTQTIRVDEKPQWRFADIRQGKVESLQMEIEIPDEQVDNVLNLDVNTAELGIVVQERIGNL